MKKTYIHPSIKAKIVRPTTIIATSGGMQSKGVDIEFGGTTDENEITSAD